MATVALPRPIAPLHSSSAGVSASSPPTPILLDTVNAQLPVPVPNKHIPECPPGPLPHDEPNTPPPSPGKEEDQTHRSLLYPPDAFPCIKSGQLSLHRIDAADVVAAIDHLSQQPLPDPSQVFPWLHGLHSGNLDQMNLLVARRRALKRTPVCLRGITIVKADGDLNVSRLKGAIAPHEFLKLGGATPDFLDLEAREGYSVRNFQIQAVKLAMTSDIVVYGEDDASVRKLAWDIAGVQQRWREKHEIQRHQLPIYNTFICVGPFTDFEEEYPEIVSVDSMGRLTGNVMDFFHQERKEMYAMAEASEVARNVWLGPTPDLSAPEEHSFDILIECSDQGRLNPGILQAIAEGCADETSRTLYVDFPSSGLIFAPTWSQAEADGILDMCKWIYHLAHGTHPSVPQTDDDGDLPMLDTPEGTRELRLRPRKILIHCADGYTESTLLGIAYYSYSTGQPIPDAWLDLHTTMERNFFAYPSDVALLSAIAPRLLQESPARAGASLSEITSLLRDEPKWFSGFDGSFPSRILDCMYLGNLGHANNPDLLRALGIGQLLSVGEMAMWRVGELEEWGPENTCIVHAVQDNGIDPLTDEFERCLEFIDRGRRNGTATLVHCRVGVSRSATICIAEVMRSLNMSFPRAYCFVRARRLNVIIQPHLRFAYELLKWEEALAIKALAADGGGTGAKRELEWGEIAREVALMNRPYAR
ncbi:hypothetical protein B0H63DRAFT_493769 [Podospora didyma]|uniref:Protein-tyrosine-phosphatase n=1 Tax=Podospora didyma TaxID=330526 RepID=A0AAE0U1I3_9PEZI|nr:hypothetical protein B0H63DRAFT_493769 [Podospora didyma]